MRQSAEINEIAKALVALQEELAPIAKTSVNPHFKNKYASLDVLIGDVRPKAARHGLAIVQGGGESASGVCVTTMLIHTSGQWLASDYQMPLEKGTAQSVGSAITYGRRYGLGSILSLATEDDDDGQAASQQKARARQWKETPVKPAPEAPTDDQLQQIQDLAIATETWESVKPKMKTLTAETAADWITRLTKKLQESK